MRLTYKKHAHDYITSHKHTHTYIYICLSISEIYFLRKTETK